MAVHLTIDGRPVAAEPGETILDAARRAGVRIPTLCHADGLPHWTSCFLCVVQVEGRRNLTPACSAPAEEGMVVTTDSEAVRTSRRTALELLLSDHRGDCIAPCTLACPAGVDVPGFIAHIRAGGDADAVALIKERIPLPAALGRLCAGYCERVCRRRESEEAVAIRELHRYAADVDLTRAEPYLPERRPATGRRVAIVGTGPAGLSAAFYLLRDGHECTLYDELPEPGGTLRPGTPDFALPPDVLDGEIDVIRRLGAVFRVNERIAAAAGLEALLAGADAVLVATGAGTGESLGLPVSGRGVVVEGRTAATARPGVFAAGDVVTGPAPPVRAVAAGRLAAVCIGQYLAGDEVNGEPWPFNVNMGRISDADRTELLRDVPRAPREDLSAGGREAALRECARCLQCDCLARDDCGLRVLSAEYGASVGRFRGEPRPFTRDDSAGDVVFEAGKCILCGLCVRIAESRGERLGIGFAGRGFATGVAVPFNESLREGLPETRRLCAQACPTGALSLRPARGAEEEGG